VFFFFFFFWETKVVVSIVLQTTFKSFATSMHIHHDPIHKKPTSRQSSENFVNQYNVFLHMSFESKSRCGRWHSSPVATLRETKLVDILMTI